jgi:hypothetical protein
MEVNRLGNLLEIRAPVLAPGIYKGGDKPLPDGSTYKQPTVRYSPDFVKKIIKTALGKNGDILHSDSKFDVVSFITETYLNEDVGYVRALVHNQDMIKKILSGEFKGISMQASVNGKWHKEDKVWDAVDGEIVAYGHTPDPAVPSANIESMATIALSHTVISQALNNDDADSTHITNKTESVQDMTGDEKVAELTAELAAKTKESEELAKAKEEQEAKMVEMSTKLSELETLLATQKQESEAAELKALLSKIKGVDESFDPKLYLHDSMSHEAQLQVLNAIFEDKQKVAQPVSLSNLQGTPGAGGDDDAFDEDAIYQEFGLSLSRLVTGREDNSLGW